jgi:hypothetical protein
MAISRSAVATKPVTVNDKVVDSVTITITSVKALVDAPSMALGSIFQRQAHSLGIVHANVIVAQ